MNEKEPLLSVSTNSENSPKTYDAAERNCSTEHVKLSWLERRRRKNGLIKYNEYQRNLMRLYEEDDAFFEQNSCIKAIDDNSKKAEQRRYKDSILARISFTLNVLLIFGNGFASIFSGSLSIISTFIDSLVDTTSGLLIMLSTWAIKNTDTFKYPRGRARLELVAALMCSTIMGVANIMMIIQSVESVVNGTVDPSANLPTISLIVGGCLAKIILLTVCYRHGTPSSRILALDQRNDILTSVVALSCAFIGDYYWVYADPIGAICVW